MTEKIDLSLDHPLSIDETNISMLNRRERNSIYNHNTHSAHVRRERGRERIRSIYSNTVEDLVHRQTNPATTTGSHTPRRNSKIQDLIGRAHARVYGANTSTEREILRPRVHSNESPVIQLVHSKNGSSFLKV